MKIVVTGALGHIGAGLIRSLPESFHDLEITMIDNLLTQRYCSLFGLPKHANFKFVEGDVRTENLEALFEGANAVIHLAAITDATASYQNKDETLDVNARGSERVAQACLQSGVPLFFPSTTSVYGKSSGVVSESCSESDLNPQSPYAQSKLDTERLLAGLGEKGLRYVVCRFGTIVGVSAGIRFHTAVNKFCFQAVMKQPITVWSTALKQDRPYLDLTDALNAISFILKKKLFDGRIYNVVTDNLSVEQLIEMIKAEVCDVKVELVEHEIMNQLSYKVSAQKIRDAGFEFQGNLKKAIQETIQLLQ